MDSSPEVVSKEEGLRLLKAGQLDDAIRILEKARDKGSDDAQVCAYLGAAYSQKDDKLNAIHAFEESLRLQETPKAYFNLAVMYERVGRVDEAVREFRMALDLDPSYAPAQEAMKRLQDQFAASQPQPEPAAAATQVMTAGAPAGSQTQAFSGPPPGPAVGQAPTPIADPFARQFSPPPTQADLLALQMQKEQEIADQHHKMMKSGVIYGAICGSIFITALNFALRVFAMGSLPNWAVHGNGLILYTLIVALVGAVYGCLVGLWVGFTCGGESAGTQAGAAIGALLGILFGVLLTGSPGGVVLFIAVFAIPSALVGMLVGRMVDMSISD